MPLSCTYTDLPTHFGFLLPLAGITTVSEIKNNPIDIKATGRLDKLYVALLQDERSTPVSLSKYLMKPFGPWRVELSWENRTLPYRIYDKRPRVSSAAVVENKWLSDVLAYIKANKTLMHEKRLLRTASGQSKAIRALETMMFQRVRRVAAVPKQVPAFCSRKA